MKTLIAVRTACSTLWKRYRAVCQLAIRHHPAHNPSIIRLRKCLGELIWAGNVGIGTTQGTFIPGEIIQATESFFFNIVTQVTASCNGIQTSISVGSTAGIQIGMALKESFAGAGNTVPIVGGGSTIIAIGSGTISIHPPSVCIPCPVSAVLSIGTTAYSNYSLDFFDEDNQNTTFESNEIIESEADDILDFSEGNPFGTF